jgi:putative ABC transport system permease protein
MDLKLTHDQTSILGSGYFVHNNFFDMFSFPMIHGDPGTAFTNPTSIVLTQELAQKLFGTADPIGNAVKIEDGYDFTVTGLMADIPHNSHIQFDYLLSFTLAPSWMQKWDNKSVKAYVMLDENTPYQGVTEKIWNVYNDHNPNSTRNNLYLVPLERIHLHSLYGGGPIVYIYIFTAMALLILLIACINFTNLSTARSQKRFKEIGIKKVVGSNRFQLMKQFLTESILLSLIALVFAVIILEILLPQINSAMGTHLKLAYTWNIILGLIGIAVITGIAAGSYPAFFLSSFRPIAALKGQFSLVPRRRGLKPAPTSYTRSTTLRKVLVVSQFALSIFFIVCVIVLFNQLNYLKNKDLGYNKDQVLMLQTRGESAANAQLIKQQLLQNPDIESISISDYGLTQWQSSTGVIWEGKQDDEMFDVGCNWVDYDYVKTYDLEMIQGRFFDKGFATDASNAMIVNQALLEQMGLENPIGKWITRAPGSSYEETGTIIGVIKNFHTESLHGDIRPFILRLSEDGNLLNIRIKPDNIPATLSVIEKTVKEFAPTDLFEYSFLDDQLNSLYRSEQLMGHLTTYIAILAIFISCLGLFGLASFTAEQRTKEIGIRKVLGATVSNIITLMSKEFLILVAIANIIAIPIAYVVMNRWLQDFAFHVNIGWLTFAFAIILTLLIASIAVSFQAIKAAIANPVESLRYE